MTETSIYIANLGKYNEGFLVGKWINLPFTDEELQALFVSIGLGRMENGEYIPGLEVDGIVYEEHAIHDYDTDIEGFKIGEYDDLDKLNEIVTRYNDLTGHEADTVAAAVEYLGYDPLEVIENIDDFNLYPDITSEYELGYYWAVESGCYDIDEESPLSRYFDYEAFGRDISLETTGGFTSRGWLEERC